MLVYFVEDDQNISYVILKTLEKMNLSHEAFFNGESFKASFENQKPDLVLLDLMLPDTSGLDLIKYVRKFSQTIPIIVISALFDEMDKVKALDLGADDYITKPFGILELTSRIQAKLRKVSNKKIFNLADITVDFKKYKVYSNEEEIILTNKEFEVLTYLLKNSDEVLTKENIFFNVWNTDFMGETRALDMHIKALRQKLDEVNSSVKIETVYGVGYKIGIK